MRKRIARAAPAATLPIRERSGKEAARQLEYDFILHPGANPDAIELRFDGAKKLALNRDGDVVAMLADGGKIIQHLPAIYQEQNGHREKIAGRCILRGKSAVGFALADYDRNRPVDIDPGLVYSTYLGGSTNDLGNGIAVDSAGNAYVTGFTQSSDFPVTAGAFQTTFPDTSSFFGSSVFVTKMNATGSALVYSTYLGGSSGTGDLGYGIAIDSSGNAYVTGLTKTIDFPTTPGAYQTINHDSGSGDAFVTKLNATGTGLIYSTFLGGSGYCNTGTGQCFGDQGNSIAIDSAGNAYVAGQTYSSNFPTTGSAYQSSLGGGNGNAFVTKVTSDGSGLVYSTYLGGNGNNDSLLNGDSANGIAIDSSGIAYVTGYTASNNFPTTANAFQTANNAYSGGTNVFVSKLDPARSGGASPVYSTYLGGSGGCCGGGDQGRGIAVDSSGNAYVTGAASSTDFPTTAGAYQTTTLGGRVGFVTKLNSSGSAPLIYSTFLGAVSGENGIVVDSSGSACVISGYPVTYVTKLNAAGSGVDYSANLGAYSGNAIALDSSGNVYVTGLASRGLPITPGAFQPNDHTLLGRDVTAFVQKYALPTAAPTATPTAVPTTSISFAVSYVSFYPCAVGDTCTASQTTPPGTVTITNNGSQPGYVFSAASSDTTHYNVVGGGTGTCPSSGAGLAPGHSCGIPVNFTPTAAGNAPAGYLELVTNASGSPLKPIKTALVGRGIAAVKIAQTTLIYSHIMLGNAQTLGAIVYNYSAAPVTIGAIGFSGTNLGDFSAGTPSCGAAIPAGSPTAPAACTIPVTFTPTGVGTESAAMRVANSSPSTPAAVALSSLSTIPDTVSTYVAFGTIPATGSQVKSFTITNLSGTSLATSITSFSIADFTDAGTGTCNTGPVAPSSSCTYDIKFVPTAGGTRTGAILVNVGNDPYSPRKVTAVGIGQWPTVTPINQNFGAVTVGSPRLAFITFTNTEPQPVVLAPSLSDTVNYSIASDTCPPSPTPLGGKSRCTLEVEFDPTGIGALNGTFSVSDTGSGDPGSPHAVHLYGSGK
ncbi:MAG: SBBP repeat-containing protein [Candidatus Binataceae bacterium]